MTTAAATVAPPAEPLPRAVQRLLETRHPNAADRIRWQARSRTMVDAGSWLARVPLHAIVCGDRLVLVAAGPRPVVVDLPLEALARAVYNHVTGEIVFPRPTGRVPVPPLRLDPLVARGLLALAPPPTNPISPSGTLSHA